MGGKRRNEFAEWHVARLAELHNYVKIMNNYTLTLSHSAYITSQTHPHQVALGVTWLIETSNEECELIVFATKSTQVVGSKDVTKSILPRKNSQFKLSIKARKGYP